MGYQAATAELDQKKRELHQKTLILQSVMGSMGDGVVITDDAGNLMHVNDAFSEMVGNIPIPDGTDQWPRIVGIFKSDNTPLLSLSELSVEGMECHSGKTCLPSRKEPDIKLSLGQKQSSEESKTSELSDYKRIGEVSKEKRTTDVSDQKRTIDVSDQKRAADLSDGKRNIEVYVQNAHLKEKIWLQASASILKMPDGTYPGGMVIVFRDFTRKKHEELSLIKAKENAEATARAKTNFLSVMSHELRTPLSGILGMAQNLKTGLFNTDELSCIDSIIHNSNELLGKIKNILDYNQLESGDMQLIHEVYSLDSIVRELRDLHGRKAAFRGIGIKTDMRQVKGRFYKGDYTRLIQIVDILMDNAIKFSEDKGDVHLDIHIDHRQGAEHGKERLLFKISDNGIGLSIEQMKRLFTPFSQADSSYSRKFEGTGLGLAICKKLIEAMKGTISVESKPGEGSCFKLCITQQRVIPPCGDNQNAAGSTVKPVHKSKQKAGQKPTKKIVQKATSKAIQKLTPNTVQEADSKAVQEADTEKIHGTKGSIKILVAEDNRVNQMLIKKVLGKMGYEPIIVDNGKKAVQACEDGFFDLILMDIQMPEMD
ncbi:MAG: response regulator, partial [Desulfamplus sp.]|nr:response regulator [Desulfamplus sp.]